MSGVDAFLELLGEPIRAAGPPAGSPVALMQDGRVAAAPALEAIRTSWPELDAVGARMDELEDRLGALEANLLPAEWVEPWPG